ncbi:MAG: hypothetical protein FJX22_04670, partial [Alphaproteobacteria bacterium]|nr:hypothetical protein [Alphaproteobacteria bacterium]
MSNAANSATRRHQAPQQVVEGVLCALAQRVVKPVFSQQAAAGAGLQGQVALPSPELAAPSVRNLGADAASLASLRPPSLVTTMPAPNLSADPVTPLSAQTRASGDAVACLARFHDAELHRSLQPPQLDAANLLAAAEQVRCLELGARLYPGIAASQLQAIGDRHAASSSDSPQAQTLADLLWLRWHGGDDHQALMQQLAMQNPQLAGLVQQLAGSLHGQLSNQRHYANLIQNLAQRLGLISTVPDPEDNLDQDDAPESLEAVGDAQPPPTGQPEPPPTDPQQDKASPPPPPMPQLDHPRVDTQNDNGQQPQDQPPRPDLFAMVDQQIGYHVFSRDHDELLDAATLVQPNKIWTTELMQDNDAAQYRQLVKRLAIKLERLLRTERPINWQSSLQDGALDAKRLARLISSPLQPPLYRQITPLQSRDTVITLLLDCSGSMRGRPIRLAMLTVDVLLQTLERCHINTELLGFTTRSWKGGRAREKWIEGGKPPLPGRLNDLRHLLFKTANQRWPQRRASLGALLQEGVLKENIDGEALQWAARRLLPRPERRKILIVISDGAPVDDASIAANDEGI